jgi:hypothetical protein
MSVAAASIYVLISLEYSAGLYCAASLSSVCGIMLFCTSCCLLLAQRLAAVCADTMQAACYAAGVFVLFGS